jgi:hypothetical protein
MSAVGLERDFAKGKPVRRLASKRGKNLVCSKWNCRAIASCVVVLVLSARALRAQEVCQFDDVVTQAPATVVAQTADNEAWISGVQDLFAFDLAFFEDGENSRVYLADPYDNGSLSVFSADLQTKFANIQPNFQGAVAAITQIPSGLNEGLFYVLDAGLENCPATPRIGVMDRDANLVEAFQPVLGLPPSNCQDGAPFAESRLTAMDISPDGSEIAVIDAFTGSFYILDLTFSVVSGATPFLGTPSTLLRSGICWNSCDTLLIISSFRSPFLAQVALEYDRTNGTYTGRGLDLNGIANESGAVVGVGLDFGVVDGNDVAYVYNAIRDAAFAINVEYSVFPGPVENLLGSRGDDGDDPLTLSWDNNPQYSYDTIVVRQNDVEIATLPGDATELMLPDTISGRAQFEVETRNAPDASPITNIWVDVDGLVPPILTSLAPGLNRFDFGINDPNVIFSFMGLDSRPVVSEVNDNQIFALFSIDFDVYVISGDNSSILDSFPLGVGVVEGLFAVFIGIAIVNVEGVERLAVLGLGGGSQPIAGIFEMSGENRGDAVQIINGLNLDAVGGVDGVFFTDWDTDANGDFITVDVNNNRLVRLVHDFGVGTITAVEEAPLPQCVIGDCGFLLAGGAVTVLPNGMYLVAGGGLFSGTTDRAFLATPFDSDPLQSVQFTGYVRGLVTPGDLLPVEQLGPGQGGFRTFGLTATYYDLTDSETGDPVPVSVVFYTTPSDLTFTLGAFGLFGGDIFARLFNLGNGPSHPDLVAEQLTNTFSAEGDFSTPAATPTFSAQADTVDYYYHVVNRSASTNSITVQVSLDGQPITETLEMLTIPEQRSVYRALTGRAESEISVQITNPDTVDFQVLVGASAIAPRAGGPVFRRGDHDGSGEVDITDPLNLLGFLFIGNNPPICHDASDGDNSGDIDISDPLNLLTFLFLGTVAIPTPGSSECGPDPTGAILPGEFTGLPGQPAAADEGGAPFGGGPLGCDFYPDCTDI